jgi:enoyl-CoA hydratase/carnithine racemase
MAMSARLEISRDESVLLLAINRPEKKNALDCETYNAMTAALLVAESDAAIRTVVITGRGGVFTAGNDIRDFASFKGNFRSFPALNFVRKIAAFSKPIVAAVAGDAIGVGVTLLFHCDLVYAAQGARFKLPFVDLGLVPEGGSSLLMPQRFGLARASQYLLLGDPFTAEEALRFGLVNAIAAREDVVEMAVAAAKRLAAKPADALAAARRLIRGDTAAVLSAIEEEAEQFIRALSTPQAQARFAAFLAGDRDGGA